MLASGGASGGVTSTKSPKKGILKNRGVGFSLDQPAQQTVVSPRASSANYEKSARWDEMNILQTYHPPDKDYGHMKIDEPKTPFNYGPGEDVAAGHAAPDADEIQRRLKAEQKMALATSHLHGSHVSLSSEDDNDEVEETPEQRARREMFEDRRKKHYNEGHLLKDAKRMVEQELEQLEHEGGEPMEDEDMADADEMTMDDPHSAAQRPRNKVTSSYEGPGTAL